MGWHGRRCLLLDERLCDGGEDDGPVGGGDGADVGATTARDRGLILRRHLAPEHRGGADEGMRSPNLPPPKTETNCASYLKESFPSVTSVCNNLVSYEN